uniref:heparosan-N-sulfate-glucuronate 5-epimerase n=1 Tax=Anisakis simplex TaxID=6269 RepID=A0A0M3J7P5_ANISI
LLKVSFQEHFYYELGAKPDPSSWRLICRDVLTDAGRALASTVSNGKKTGSTSAAAQLHPGDVRVISLVLRGHSWLHSLKQRSSAHMEQFLVVADWFLSNQDDDGGWSVPVERSIAEKSLVLEAGWHSAMAQGHALSVLTRAYAITKELKYLRAAVKGTKLFKINAGEGGVRNDLFGYAWYEEYPTQPGTFVLNGFMYSLIGLYDLSAALKNQQQMENDAAKLFADGIRSLQTFLP